MKHLKNFNENKKHIIENIKDVRAEELQFDIEEHSIRGGHDFKVHVAFGTDLSKFDIKVDEETHRVLDEEFIEFIRDQYSELSRQ